MPGRKPQPKRKISGYSGGFCSTPAQRAAQARIEQDADRSNRAMSNALMFWRVCAKARCRRMRACAGIQDCFSNKWRQLHADDRFFLREALRARQSGASPDHAAVIARQRLAERDALEARFDVNAVHQPMRPQSPPPPQPRVRRL